MRIKDGMVSYLYKTLRLLMASKCISIDAIARLLGVHRNTVTSKLDGESDFSFDQAMLIASTLFPEYKPGYIFQRSDDDKPA